MKSQPIWTIYNQHAPSCGTPPTIDSQTGDYHGYFQNEHGEQWLFVYDRSAGTATLYGGDIGWEDPVTMEKPQSLEPADVMQRTNLVLSPPEFAWLAACWRAATAFERQR